MSTAHVVGSGVGNAAHPTTGAPASQDVSVKPRWWKRAFRSSPKDNTSSDRSSETKDGRVRQSRWSFGILNDPYTDDVPGSVMLLSLNPKEPLELVVQLSRAATPRSSIPGPLPSLDAIKTTDENKRTPDGKVILQPQPDDSPNDPLNWPAWKRDVALICLGFYCMVGGGTTPLLAAGFGDVAKTYSVSIPEVARTVGLYMLGLGIGSVITSPTAILYGKRPVYLVGSIVYCAASIWCAASPSYISLLLARIVQGMAVSPVECLPSSTIAEIFFLHERAYRIGVYTLLLLGGKNLVPLVSAVIIQGLGWRWVFWVVAMIVGMCFFLLFLFVPETFWDRTPRPDLPRTSRRPSQTTTSMVRHDGTSHQQVETALIKPTRVELKGLDDQPGTIAHRRKNKPAHVGWASDDAESGVSFPDAKLGHGLSAETANSQASTDVPSAHHFNRHDTPYYPVQLTTSGLRQDVHTASPGGATSAPPTNSDAPKPALADDTLIKATSGSHPHDGSTYTDHLRTQPPRTYVQTLKLYNGRLIQDSWLRVAFRPFILFAYPAVLWSTLVYSLSIGWLIVLSETVASVYRVAPYNFSALGTGLVYLSPFIGGILGTAIAGKCSDLIVRFMSRRNGGLYEPEFRLVMAFPVMISTCIGLMGFGWSAQVHDRWIVPTFFFGLISFGCSLGSTTAITFCVDSYRQYAGEALVTLNFSKNVLHGMVFSLFFNSWLEKSGSKSVFLWIGGIQLACLLTTVPMYVFGKRARMWTARRGMMERF